VYCLTERLSQSPLYFDDCQGEIKGYKVARMKKKLGAENLLSDVMW
jgi:hypothetical protein